VALNKIDKLDYEQATIARAAAEMRAMLEGLGFTKVDVIPVSAWEGQNLTLRGDRMSWYKGRTLEEVFDALEPRGTPSAGAFRLPVMQVLQIGGVGTVVLGRIERGEVSEGDELLVVPSDKLGVVRSIEAYGKPIRNGEAGETVGVALRNIGKMDVSRGDVLGPEDDPPRLAEEFTAKIVLFGDAGVVRPGWSVYLHCHTAAVPVKLEAIEMKLRPDSGEAAGEAETAFLVNGDAAMVRLRPLKPLVIEPADRLPGMARFALRAGRETIGAGSCVSVRPMGKREAGPGTESKGFSYKWQKTGAGAKEQKKRKDEESRDIWGKPIKK
jgi:elongation factor 1-alpha